MDANFIANAHRLDMGSVVIDNGTVVDHDNAQELLARPSTSNVPYGACSNSKQGISREAVRLSDDHACWLSNSWLYATDNHRRSGMRVAVMSNSNIYLIAVHTEIVIPNKLLAWRDIPSTGI